MTINFAALPEVTKALQMDKGIFFVVEFSNRGGVKYTRIGDEHQEVHDDESMTAEYSTRKDVDHIGLASWARKIINSAYNVMERYCSHTPIGYWIQESKAPAMLQEIKEVQEEASKLNKHARESRSQRRCQIQIYSMIVGEEDQEKTAKRLAQTVRERLENLRSDLAAGDLNAYATSWKRAKNLNKMATGIQAEAIVLALEAAREARSQVNAELKNKATPEMAGKRVNLDAIESAIFLFTESVNGVNAEVTDPDVDKIF